MADAASLFGKKKKGKKFKSFNANKLSSDALIKNVNVDDDATTIAITTDPTNPSNDWDEVINKPVTKSVVTNNTDSLGSMRSMAEIEKERVAQDDLAERMRLAEIKDALNQAKKSVASNDETKAAEDKEIADGWKKVEEKPKPTPQPVTGSGKYVPKFRREGGAMGGTAMGTGYQASGAYGGGSSYGSKPSAGSGAGASGSRFGRKVDTNDSSAFPTLGGPAPTVAKTVVGGAWGATSKPAAPAATEEGAAVVEGGGESVFDFAEKP